MRSLCIARETLGYYSGLADFAMAMQGLGTGSISLFGSDELKSRYLPPVAAGEKIGAFAISEKGAGSDVANMTTAAEADGNGWVINGEKTWISNAGIADHYVVFARTGEAEGARGISAFVVDADNPGLSVSERIDVIAPHPLGTLEFNDCRIDGSHRLGEGGDGFKIAMATLDVFRSTVGAAALGFARRAMDEAIGRAESRQASARPSPSSSSSRKKSPTWPWPSTPWPCWSTARPGPRTRRKPGSRGNRPWPSCTPPRAPSR